ncbi:hypothetical protein PFISCL1PPCAC_6441, partial [Pristionchus fissidentatus]
RKLKCRKISMNSIVITSNRSFSMGTLLFSVISGLLTFPFSFYVYYRILTMAEYRKSTAFRIIVANGFM